MSQRSKKSTTWRLRTWKLRYWLGTPFRFLGNLLSRILNIHRVAAILASIAMLLWWYYGIEFDTILPNIVTDLLGVALTVFVIDTMYRLRSDAERKRVLIKKLGSKNNDIATEALHEIDAEGWLLDGSLRNAFLLSCNLNGSSFTGADLQQVSFGFASLRATTWFEADLTGAYLDFADFTGATFAMKADIPGRYAEADLTRASMHNANLTGAVIRDEQLFKTKSLWRATMPDGQLYDGRYNLPYDIELFQTHNSQDAPPDVWASFYSVTIDRYIKGQLWAVANLERVRHS